jgi:ribonuclease T2
MRRLLALCLAVALVLAVAPALATVPLDGQFLAEKDCPLFRSIRTGTQAEGVRLVPGRAYRLLGKNREEATHFLIRLEGARPRDLWVELACGTLSGPRGVGHAGPVTEGHVALAGDFVLAASWHPAFCELQAHKPECAEEGTGPEASGARGFVLHGLWPQPREKAFCEVPATERANAEAGRWSRLPALDLSEETQERLASLMPGVQSHLDRYQWSKHGSCQGADAEDYFRAALDLLRQLNASALPDLFARHVGDYLEVDEIRAVFDQSLGPGAGQRVGLSCQENMIVELRIGLRGRPGEKASLYELMQASKPIEIGCGGGRVDSPGVTRPGHRRR